MLPLLEGVASGALKDQRLGARGGGWLEKYHVLLVGPEGDPAVRSFDEVPNALTDLYRFGQDRTPILDPYAKQAAGPQGGHEQISAPERKALASDADE